MKWLLALHMGSIAFAPVNYDGMILYDSHFGTQQECRAAANVWRQLSYEALCKRVAK